MCIAQLVLQVVAETFKLTRSIAPYERLLPAWYVQRLGSELVFNTQPFLTRLHVHMERN